jgi:hypothetical protein
VGAWTPRAHGAREDRVRGFQNRFFSIFFITFLGVSRRGVHVKKQIAKSPCRNLFPKQSTKTIDVRFSSIFFVLSRVKVFLSDGSSNTLPKKRFGKKTRRKVFAKESTKQSKTDFLDIFYHVFGRFSVRGVQKRDKTILEKN